MKPTLFLMLGYPGAGKTTAAQLLSELTGAEHIWADHERKNRYGEPTYSQAENDELYNDLNDNTRELLKSGRSVIYDTAFNHYSDRSKLRTIANEAGGECIIIWVQSPRGLAKDRALETDNQPTRVLNDHTPMHHEHFEYLSDKLEEPRDDESVIIIDGTNITEGYVKETLTKNNLI